MKYSYFPGCSLTTTAVEYDTSARAVMAALGVDLVELKDWNCCGATVAEGTSYLLALALAARNLALAEANGSDVAATCSSCFLNLFRVKAHTRRDPKVIYDINSILAEVGLRYEGRARVRHLLDIIVNDVGLEAVAQRVKRRLNGIKVAPYYGCQIVRPYAEFDGPDLPITMDHLIAALGAEAIPYMVKTRCCGGVLATTRREVALKLMGDLLLPAAEADCLVTVCPLCQLNLDAYQSQVSRKLGLRLGIPILFFTQLVGLAFDLPLEVLRLERNIVSPERLLARVARAPVLR